MAFAGAFDARVALRNIGRTPRRSILMVLGVVFATMLTVVTVGLQEGSHNEMVVFQASLLNGLVQVQHPDYLDDPTIENSMDAADQILEAIQSDTRFVPPFRGVARLQAGVLLNSGAASRGAELQGIDVAQERRYGGLIATLSERENFQLAGTDVAVGLELAAALGITVDSELVVVGFTANGSLNPALARVSTVFDSGFSLLDQNVAYGSKEFVARLVDVPNGATQILLTGNHSGDYVELLKIAGDHAVGNSALSWHETNPELLESVELDDAMSYIMLGVLIFVTALAAANGLFLSQLERTREYGLLLAIGCTPLRVWLMVLLEGTILIFAGVILGAALGSAIVLYMQLNPIPLQGMDDIARLYGIRPVIPGLLNLKSGILAPLWMLLISLVAQVMISVRVLRLEPLRALRDAG